MRKLLIILALGIVAISCKKDDHPQEDNAWNITSYTDGLSVYGYDYNGGSEGHFLSKNKSTTLFYHQYMHIEVRCDGSCRYVVNGREYSTGRTIYK